MKASRPISGRSSPASWLITESSHRARSWRQTQSDLPSDREGNRSGAGAHRDGAWAAAHEDTGNQALVRLMREDKKEISSRRAATLGAAQHTPKQRTPSLISPPPRAPFMRQASDVLLRPRHECQIESAFRVAPQMTASGNMIKCRSAFLRNPNLIFFPPKHLSGIPWLIHGFPPAWADSRAYTGRMHSTSDSPKTTPKPQSSVTGSVSK